MNLRLSSCWLIAWFALSAPVYGQVKFERKYPEGAKFETHVESKTTQTLTIVGQDIKTTSNSFELESTTIGKRQEDGKLSIEKKAETLRVELNINGTKLDFDSGDPDKKADNSLLQPVLDLLKASLKGPTTIVYDKNNDLVEVKVDPKVTEGLPDAYKKRFEPETLKQEYGQRQLMLPKTEVKPGDTWELTHSMRLDGQQSLEFTTTYTFTGTVEKDGKSLLRVESKDTAVKLLIEADPKAMVQITKSDLKVAESKGEVLFDPAAGRMQERSGKIHILGELTLTVAAQNLAGKLDLTIESTEKVP